MAWSLEYRQAWGKINFSVRWQDELFTFVRDEENVYTFVVLTEATKSDTAKRRTTIKGGKPLKMIHHSRDPAKVVEYP
jgi:predicted Zn-dependent protease